MKYAAILLALLLSVGCMAPYTAVKSQEKTRSELLKLQEEQIKDNLARARFGLPLMHMNYHSINGSAKMTLSSKIEGGGTNEETLTTGTTTFDATDGGDFGAEGSASLENTLNLSATICDKRYVYAQYREYAKRIKCAKEEKEIAGIIITRWSYRHQGIEYWLWVPGDEEGCTKNKDDHQDFMQNVMFYQKEKPGKVNTLEVFVQINCSAKQKIEKQDVKVDTLPHKESTQKPSDHNSDEKKSHRNYIVKNGILSPYNGDDVKFGTIIVTIPYSKICKNKVNNRAGDIDLTIDVMPTCLNKKSLTLNAELGFAQWGLEKRGICIDKVISYLQECGCKGVFSYKVTDKQSSDAQRIIDAIKKTTQ